MPGKNHKSNQINYKTNQKQLQKTGITYPVIT